MPIVVRQALPGVLGRLAVRAGRARGQQLQMARDIQFTQIALTAQDRAAAVGAAARDRAFAMQRAAATQIARQRPAEPGLQDRRRKARRFVSEAKAADIYDPAQIKQMQIFADLGDEKAVRSIAGELPPVTVRRRELEKQAEVVAEIGKRDISTIQKQLAAVNEQLGEKFAPSMQQYLRGHPEFMEKFTTPKIQELMSQQQQLEEQITEVTERTAGMGRMLQLGITVPEQMVFEQRQEAALERQEAAQQRLEIQRTRGIGGLTKREELTIDIIRDRALGDRTAIGKEIERLSKGLAPFEDESEKEHLLRTGPIRAEIQLNELKITASHANEKKQIEVFLRGGGGTQGRPEKFVAGVIYTNAAGQRARFTGYDETGQPILDVMD